MLGKLMKTLIHHGFLVCQQWWEIDEDQIKQPI